MNNNKNGFVPDKPTWCPGCGDWGILAGINQTIKELDLKSHNVAICYGIGCAGNMSNNIKAYGFHSLHGRSLPPALGIKIANKDLTVLTVAGDGDFYAEGGNHFLHVGRYNIDITSIVADNRIFSLTTGQASPTSDKDFKTKTTFWGEFKEPLNPIALAIISGATFVARTSAFDLKHMKEMFKQAIEHKGYSVVNVIQQCISFNKHNTVQWYKERMYDLSTKKHDYTNKDKALKKAYEETTKSKLPVGIFYKEDRATYISSYPQLMKKNNKNVRIEELLKEFY